MTPDYTVRPEGDLTKYLATCREAAEFLRMTEGALRNRLNQNPDSFIKPVHVGRSIRFRWVDLHALASGLELSDQQRSSPGKESEHGQPHATGASA